MHILIYCDNHFCTYSSIVRGRGIKYSVRLENQIQSISWAESLAEEYNCDCIIHLGDFFDKPDLNSEELTALKEIKWSKVKHYFIVGNHEIASKDLYYNSLNVLANVGKVVDKPEMLSVQGCDIVLLPYVVGVEKPALKSIIEELCKGTLSTQEVKNRIILSHNDIKGLQYGQYVSKLGFDIEDIYDNCDLFINGHLHNQTQINKKMLNLGNLTGQNFSEDAEKYSHCVAILDTDTLKVDLINNPYALNFYKFDFTIRPGMEETLLKCKNGVVTAKVYESSVSAVREFIKNKCNIIEYRLISVAEHTSIEPQSKLELTTVNHIDKFKEYLLKNIENTDVLLEEINSL